MRPKNLLPHDGEVYYYPSVFNEKESQHFLKDLTENILWKQEPVRLFGKEIMQPRLTAWYGNSNKPYTYSGTTMSPQGWTAVLAEIKKRVEMLAGVEFTSVLLNMYRNGNDYMGWHRDNEKSLGSTPGIASISFGAARVFQLQYYSNKENKISVLLEPGSLIMMKGVTQQFWEHRLPKTPRLTASRINLTFRYLI